MKISLLSLLLCSSLVFSEEVVFTPQNPNGVYKLGEKIVWKVHGDKTLKDIPYVVKSGGLTVIGQGKLDLSSDASIETSLDKPGTVLVDLTIPVPGKPENHVFAGAVVAPEKIEPSLPRPADFDEFWKAKIEELNAIPENPALEKAESDKPNVDYWKIQLDNINGTHVYGQLARPAHGEKLPAMLVVQYAGVYPLPKANVTGPAAEGWLTLNIMAHDLPIDKPESYYKDLAELKKYSTIGNDDREKSYFLRMFLGCYRAVEYLSKRPDWDGKTLIVTGTSQGGLQSIVSAGLNPKVTAIMINVPAGCDNTAETAGRAAGWPYWLVQARDKDPKMAQETSRYFDAMNFSYHVKCPALIGVGLIDVTARAAGIFAAVNQFTGPKEVVVLPNSDHHGTHNTQAAFHARAGTWRAALLAGKPLPIK